MEKLGIEPKLLIAQMVNFFIVMVLLKKYLYKPILAQLEKRKKEIAEGVALASKMKDEEEKLKAKEEKALAAARTEALSIIDGAKAQAKDVERDLLAKSHDQAAAIIERAREEARAIEKASEDKLRKQAVELAVVMSQRLLSSVMSAKAQHSVIAAHTKDLEKWAKEESSE